MEDLVRRIHEWRTWDHVTSPINAKLLTKGSRFTPAIVGCLEGQAVGLRAEEVFAIRGYRTKSRARQPYDHDVIEAEISRLQGVPDAEKGFPPPDEEETPGEILRIAETMAGTKHMEFVNRIRAMYNRVRKHFAIAGPYQPVSFHVVASWFRHHLSEHLRPADHELLMDDIANWEDWSHAESPFKTAKTLRTGPRRVACLRLEDEALWR